MFISKTSSQGNSDITFSIEDIKEMENQKRVNLKTERKCKWMVRPTQIWKKGEVLLRSMFSMGVI
jgi:hypothetical protein